jgi:predicted Holliday junction resolvase-like endonuclease
MIRTSILLIFVLTLLISAVAQKKSKPWTEWSEKEIDKMLNESAWGQTQTETDTSEMFYKPNSSNRMGNRPLEGSSGSGNNRSAQGQLNQATSINYRIRLLTAKPIRQALARRVLMQKPELAEQLNAFVERQNDRFIVDYDSKDSRYSGPAMQIFNSSNTGTLKNNTYLENKDGKRLFLQEYIAPINDGMGAKFVFSRTMENEPL